MEALGVRVKVRVPLGQPWYPILSSFATLSNMPCCPIPSD